MKYRNRWLIFVLILTLSLSSFVACNKSSENGESQKDILSETDSPTTSETKKNEEDEALSSVEILVDLNSDGADDKVVLTPSAATSDKKETPTIQVISGSDSSEMLSDTFGMSSPEKGGYALRIEKNSSTNQLLYWYYMTSDTNLIFRYETYDFSINGEKVFDKKVSKRLDLSNGTKIISQNEVFLTMRDELNSLLSASWSYDVYVLLDNSGENLVFSTTENMIEPSALTFELMDFTNG